MVIHRIKQIGGQVVANIKESILYCLNAISFVQRHHNEYIANLLDVRLSRGVTAQNSLQHEHDDRNNSGVSLSCSRERGGEDASNTHNQHHLKCNRQLEKDSQSKEENRSSREICSQKCGHRLTSRSKVTQRSHQSRRQGND